MLKFLALLVAIDAKEAKQASKRERERDRLEYS